MNDNPRLENLKPFPPGVSGNPAGRAKGTENVSTRLKRILSLELDVNDPITKEKGKKSIAEIIGLRLASDAMAGNIKAIKIVLDRVEGKVTSGEPSQEEWIGEQLQIIVNEEEAKKEAEKFLE